jgi:hypothetical protein
VTAKNIAVSSVCLESRPSALLIQGNQILLQGKLMKRQLKAVETAPWPLNRFMASKLRRRMLPSTRIVQRQLLKRINVPDAGGKFET